MATMIPDKLAAGATKGERAVFRFLKRYARPDDEHLVWCQPLVRRREPDFVLLSPDAGLLVIEVKDWAAGQIAAANAHTVTLRIGSRREERENPVRQAKEYAHRIRDLLRAERDRTGGSGPEVPVGWAVAYPHIRRSEFRRLKVSELLGAGRAFFWDDFHEGGGIARDPSGAAFRRVMRERFGYRKKVRLGSADRERLRGLLFPEVRVETPREAARQRYEYRREILAHLDHNQESVARTLQAGHKLISGPAGSGKTLVLVARAALLYRAGRSMRPILLLCYNASLAGYLERLLAAKKVPLGPRGVEVLPFFELCERILGERIDHDRHDEDLFEEVTRKAARKLEMEGPRYRSVLVDEGQDFSSSMLAVVSRLLHPDPGELTIAVDPAQDLYRRHSTWKSAGVQARGRVHRLRGVYRNTRAIAELGERILRAAVPAARPEPRQLAFPGIFADEGPAPVAIECGSPEEVAAELAQRIATAVESEGYPLCEAALLYTHRRGPGGAPECYPELLLRAVGRRGLLAHWVSESYRTKRCYDITTERVTVSTVHSAKGLDYECVGLVGLDLLEGDLTDPPVRNLVHTAVTRARRHLWIGYFRRTPLIEQVLELLRDLPSARA
ncbi:MAG: hypothetical protein D6718_04585 [Acidobacteria bacterium]|nr:MAG: hypothetical protein D6718_04585 [Acidobacteriota bacterium]